jgi:hypothetical protein
MTILTYANGYGIIFVDNGNDTHIKQFLEGVDGVQVSRPLPVWNVSSFRDTTKP